MTQGIANVSQYNANVSQYNANVSQYNATVNRYNANVSQYNAKVSQYNATVNRGKVTMNLSFTPTDSDLAIGSSPHDAAISISVAQPALTLHACVDQGSGSRVCSLTRGRESG